jgi:hypothetical protein
MCLRKRPLFCDSALLSRHITFGLHYGVWVIDDASHQAYNVFVVVMPWER